MSIRRFEIVQRADLLTEEQIIAGFKGRRSVRLYAYILHDKDTYTIEDEKENTEHKAGTLKPPHWHIIGDFYENQQQQIKYVARWFGVPDNMVQKIKSRYIEDAFCYLIHQNAPKKYQYDASEVKANFDYISFIANDSIFLTREDEIVAQITTGIITRVNMTEHITAHEYVEYKRSIENAFDYYERAHYTLDRSLDVVYIYGSSGLGKTTLAKYIAQQRGLSCFIASIGTDMLDGYNGEAAIILDDIRENCGLTYDQFLRTIDNNTNARGKARFRNKNMAFCKLIIISTILPMDELMDRLDPSKQEDRKQFRRRCKFYIQVNKDYLLVQEYDFATDKYTNNTYLVNPVKELIKKASATPKLTGQEISNFLAIPQLPDDQNPILKKKPKPPTKTPPSPFLGIAMLPDSGDIPPSPF